MKKIVNIVVPVIGIALILCGSIFIPQLFLSNKMRASYEGEGVISANEVHPFSNDAQTNREMFDETMQRVYTAQDMDINEILLSSCSDSVQEQYDNAFADLENFFEMGNMAVWKREPDCFMDQFAYGEALPVGLLSVLLVDENLYMNIAFDLESGIPITAELNVDYSSLYNVSFDWVVFAFSEALGTEFVLEEEAEEEKYDSSEDIYDNNSVSNYYISEDGEYRLSVVSVYYSDCVYYEFTIMEV